ncbi:MAG: hypothetical protein IPJ69_04885 [Deltaproteobacteria bacterium]|nr:MAG: hypothetical protein IPJ69_04885 [Deltaproteobacteria bacterium]
MNPDKPLIELCLGSPAKLRLLKTLFSWKGKDLPENQLAQLSKLSTYGARHALSDIETSGLIHKKIIGHSNVWTLNETSFAFQNIQPVFEKILDIPSPLEFVKKQILNPLKNIEGVFKIFLFGSVPLLGLQKSGDIDVAIILQKSRSSERIKKNIEGVIDKSAEEIGLKLGKRLETHLFTAEEWEKTKNMPLGLSIKKGKELYPHEEI